MSTQTPGNQGRITSLWAAFLNTLKSLGGGVLTWTGTVLSTIAPGAYGNSLFSDGASWISRQKAYAEITLIGNVVASPLTLQNTWYPIVPVLWTNDVAPNDMSVNLVLGSIQPNVRGKYYVIASLSFVSGEPPNTLEFTLFVNGAAVPGHKVTTWIDSTTYPNSIVVCGLVDTTGTVGSHEFALFMRCTTAATISVTIVDANFTVLAV